MSIFYKVSNVSGSDISIAGLHIAGVVEDGLLPADATFYDLYDELQPGVRRNMLAEIISNPFLIRAIALGDIEVSYDLSGTTRGEIGPPELVAQPAPLQAAPPGRPSNGIGAGYWSRRHQHQPGSRHSRR